MVLENRRIRLKARISRLQETERRIDTVYVRVRALWFFSGVVFAFLLSRFEREGLGWLVLAFTLLGFWVLLSYHGKCRDRIKRNDHYLALLDLEDAREKQDFKRLPAAPAMPEGRVWPGYFSDLDLVTEENRPSLIRLVQASVSTGGYFKLLELFALGESSDSAVLARQTAVRALVKLRRFRRRFLIAQGEGIIDSEALRRIASHPVHSNSARCWTILVGTLQLFSSALFLGWFFGILPPWFLITWVLVFVLFKKAEEQFEEPFERALSLDLSLTRFQGIAGLLEKTISPALNDRLATFHGELRPSSYLRRLGWVVTLMSFRTNPVLQIFLNLAMPWDFVLALRLEKLRREIETRLPEWVEALSDIDVLVSLAGYADGPRLFPELVPRGGNVVEASELHHALISPVKSVPNSFELSEAQQCWILTGSNMSGKSTFLRSLGLGLLLARAGTAVPAGNFRFQNRILHTCLRIKDSVQDEISSFYAEVKALREILESARNEGAPVLYLIDEIYRGTNQKERVIGSQAYIELLLSTQAAGLVATHDLELSHLAERSPSVTNYHFRESFADGKMAFSYRLEHGPCPSTNALRIMKDAGLLPGL